MNNQLYENYTNRLLIIDRFYNLIDQIDILSKETFNIIKDDESIFDTNKLNIEFYFKLDNIDKIFKYELTTADLGSLEINIFTVNMHKLLKYQIIDNVFSARLSIALTQAKIIINTPKIDENTNNLFIEYKDKLIDILARSTRRHEALLTNMVSDTENYTWTPIDEAIHSIDMNVSYVISGDFVEESITLYEFLKLDLEDVNYNKTIYRITNDDMLPTLYEFLKKIFKLGKFHRFENVQKNKLFYIENCDLQDIQESYCESIYDVKEDGYKFVNIIH